MLWLIKNYQRDISPYLILLKIIFDENKLLKNNKKKFQKID